MQPEKDKRNPLSYTQLQPSCLPPVLNPFKAGGKTDKDSEWRRMHRGGDEEKRREEKDGKPSHKAEGREGYQKENVEVAGEKVNQEDCYRGKPLPPGMKVKKRVSDEERNSSEASGLENNTDKVQDKTKERHPKQGETEETVSTSNVKGAHPQKVHTTLQDPLQESPQHPNKGKASLVEQTKPTVKETVSKPTSSQITPGSRDSDNTRNPTSTRPTQPDDEDDDDVVVVSVKPATQKSPPVAAVQKTLTTFTGFQPKVKGQQEVPTGLHSQLTAQLQQKKVSHTRCTLPRKYLEMVYF